MALAAGRGVEADDEQAGNDDGGTQSRESSRRQPHAGEPQREHAEAGEHDEHAAAVGAGRAEADERQRQQRDGGEPREADQRAGGQRRRQEQRGGLVREPVVAAAAVRMRADRRERVDLGPEREREPVGGEEGDQSSASRRARVAPSAAAPSASSGTAIASVGTTTAGRSTRRAR